MPTNTKTASNRMTGWHRAGPWPGWLAWYRSTGWWERDAQAWDLYVAGLGKVSMQTIAGALGCHVATVSRGIARTAQRRQGDWPPKVSNGFGLSARDRRALRLRQLKAQEPRLDLGEERFKPPGEAWDEGERA